MTECVVRMELRANCLDCDMHQTMYGDTREDTEVFCVKERRYIGKRFGPTKDLARPDWCPIICQLPEGHGRLVDADALKDYLIAEAASYDLTQGQMGILSEAIDMIDEQPTIVPAEAEQKGAKHVWIDSEEKGRRSDLCDR